MYSEEEVAKQPLLLLAEPNLAALPSLLECQFYLGTGLVRNVALAVDDVRIVLDVLPLVVFTLRIVVLPLVLVVVVLGGTARSILLDLGVGETTCGFPLYERHFQLRWIFVAAKLWMARV